jgi:uncharacterized coiled-coil protein SlyX
MPSKKDTQAAPVKPAHPDRTIEIQLRCSFTDKELLELGKKLAENSNLLNQQEEEAKAVAKQLKAKCEQTAAKVSECSTKISSGYEYRQVKCLVKYDTPKTGQKTVTRLDLNEIVEVAEMSLAEMQIPLPLEGGSTGGKVVSMTGKIVTPGTVEVPADGGTRDDAGDENKNR